MNDSPKQTDVEKTTCQLPFFFSNCYKVHITNPITSSVYDGPYDTPVDKHILNRVKGTRICSCVGLKLTVVSQLLIYVWPYLTHY